ncbi:MAG: hypothetical protein WCG26_00405 [Chloroflexales bacterium]
MRIVITLDPTECAALGAMARDELRYPRDQLRWLLREEAKRRGLLPAEPAQEAPQVASQELRP